MTKENKTEEKLMKPKLIWKGTVKEAIKQGKTTIYMKGGVKMKKKKIIKKKKPAKKTKTKNKKPSKKKPKEQKNLDEFEEDLAIAIPLN